MFIVYYFTNLNLRLEQQENIVIIINGLQIKIETMIPIRNRTRKKIPAKDNGTCYLLCFLR